jgi:hypothetical protein
MNHNDYDRDDICNLIAEIWHTIKHSIPDKNKSLAASKLLKIVDFRLMDVSPWEIGISDDIKEG